MYMISGSNPNCCVLPWFFSHNIDHSPKEIKKLRSGISQLQRDINHVESSQYISALMWKPDLFLPRFPAA